MHYSQTIISILSLSNLLWRASSRPLFALPSPSAVGLRSSSNPSSRRSLTTSLAFQNSAININRPTTTATAFHTSPKHETFTSLKASSSPVEGVNNPTIKKQPIPVILLAGFLGSGKTSTLKHLLENNANMKIGTIVNDVASVNIDAKLISNLNSYAEGVVELQNGCACCSLADELLTSVETLTKGGERELDAIVVELSGVADPVAVRDNWEQARLQGHPATSIASLQRTVTLIDACTFGTDWMTFDTAGERPSWTEEGDDCAGGRKVPELLAEQVEAADLLLVNKIDLAGGKQVGVASAVARGLNEKASMMEVEFGRVDVKELLGRLLILDEEEEVDDHDHGHGHKHSEASPCTEPDCTDASHSHSHEHSSECAEPDCTDTSHSHDHNPEESSCTDTDCTDTSHSHSHDHKASTAADQLGIASFVFKSSTPFNSQRLIALLNRWPVPIKDSLDFGLVMGMGQETKFDGDETIEHGAFVGVLRSKGFCWMAPTKWSDKSAGGDVWRHDTAMYWSHAGKHFGITSSGKWWGTLNKEQMKPYFADNMEEYDRIMREDWVSEEWGDRRQELVFIGTNLDESEIQAALDDCLCTAEEMDVYRAQLRNYMDATFTTVND
mmetsp:Transcript_40201/g.72435  ORF Transcript_40201/g.72435 Transcript_40201/m.72435 type:complete len:614 (-) Transcript_40201:78-1919(-)